MDRAVRSLLCSGPGTRPFSSLGGVVVGPTILSLCSGPGTRPGHDWVGSFSFAALGRGPGRSSRAYFYLYSGPGTRPIPSQPPLTQPGARPGHSLTLCEHCDSTGRQGTPLVPTFSSTLGRGPGRSLLNPPGPCRGPGRAAHSPLANLRQLGPSGYRGPGATRLPRADHPPARRPMGPPRRHTVPEQQQEAHRPIRVRPPLRFGGVSPQRLGVAQQFTLPPGFPGLGLQIRAWTGGTTPLLRMRWQSGSCGPRGPAGRLTSRILFARLETRISRWATCASFPWGIRV